MFYHKVMNPSVILIDDFNGITEVISEYLGFHSINVLATGRNGKEAVGLYKQYRPDVVLLDLSMPKYDGWYGLENIHKINQNAKIIMLTGSIDEKIHDKLRSAGASAILPKPTPLNTLIETIKEITFADSNQLSNQIRN